MSRSDFSRSGRESAGPRDRILDLYGAFVRDFGGWIAVADLLTLLGSLDVRADSARSALSRMKRKGEIQSVSRRGARGYSLTPAAEAWFRDGTVRIMEGRPAGDEELWVVASFSVPEEGRRIRYRIRSRLRDLGYGQLAGGLMIAPAPILDESVRALERADLGHHVDFWQARHFGHRSLDDIVRLAWDLESIEQAYRHYLQLADQLRRSAKPADDREAFVRYLVNVNAWRQLPFLDPGIPLAHLPGHWPSIRARSAFEEVGSRLRAGAERHFVHVTTG